MPSLERVSARKDNALSADYTVLVLGHQSTSVPARPGEARLLNSIAKFSWRLPESRWAKRQVTK